MLRRVTLFAGIVLGLAACNPTPTLKQPILDPRTGQPVSKEVLTRMAKQLGDRLVDGVECLFDTAVAGAIKTDDPSDVVAQRVMATCRPKFRSMVAVFGQAGLSKDPRALESKVMEYWDSGTFRTTVEPVVVRLRQQRGAVLASMGTTPGQKSLYDAAKAGVFCSMRPLATSLISRFLLGSGPSTDEIVDSSIEACGATWDRAARAWEALPSYSRAPDFAFASSRAETRKLMAGLAAAGDRGLASGLSQ